MTVDEPPFKITTKRDNDKVEVKVEKDKTVFSVHSPFGISQAVIERTDEKWPDTVMLRLHLKGLENFKSHQWQSDARSCGVESGRQGAALEGRQGRLTAGRQKSVLDGDSHGRR